MDIQGLQKRLRAFAAERDWQPFHTPKNLAMALMVEAAELAEIFQWLTPDRSQAARSDRALQDRVADELADVLLYLVQIADHTGVDLNSAVERKLVKNAKKHPPQPTGRAEVAAGQASAPEIETHVLVDWENVQPDDDDIRSLVPDVTDLWLFHGPNQKGVAAKHASFGDKARPVRIARTGRNALDFHLSFYTGYIAARHPDARIVVIANDKGYGSMLEHAAELGFSARQLGFGAAAITTAATNTAVAKKSSPTRKAAAPKVATKKAPAKAAAEVAAKVATKVAAKAAAKGAAKTAVAKAAPVNAIAAPAKKVPAAKKTAAAPQETSPIATASVPEPAVDAGPAIDLDKAVRHVVASLGKTASRPAKQARLVATITALLGKSTDPRTVHSVLAQLLASGKVSVDDKGAVRYALP